MSTILNENKETEQVITLDGCPVTLELLTEKQQNLSQSERIVEVSPNRFETIRRMNG